MEKTTKTFSQISEEMKCDTRLLNESEDLNIKAKILKGILESEEEYKKLKSGIGSDASDDEVLESMNIIIEKYISYLLTSQIINEAEEEDEEEKNTEPEPESEPEEEPVPEDDEVSDDEDTTENLEKEIEKETDVEKKEQLQVLASIIKQKLIHKFAKTPVDINRITKILTNFITRGHDENNIKNELDQRAFIDFSLDVMKILLNNKRIASLVGLEAMTEEAETSVITEAKKNTIKKKRRAKASKKSATDTISPKLDMLLRLGLVDQKLYSRTKRALTNKKASGSISIYRNLLFDLLDDIIQYIQKDPTLYNRMRINVMKEMKNSLPKKEDLIAAYESGCECRKNGLTEEELPEEYMNDEFLREAWYKGFNDDSKPQFKKPHKKDSPHYRTDHHYGDGDIDPETVPVFKSSLTKQEPEKEEEPKKKFNLNTLLQRMRP